MSMGKPWYSSPISIKLRYILLFEIKIKKEKFTSMFEVKG